MWKTIFSKDLGKKSFRHQRLWLIKNIPLLFEPTEDIMQISWGGGHAGGVVVLNKGGEVEWSQLMWVKMSNVLLCFSSQQHLLDERNV